MQEKEGLEIAELILPTGILEYFDVTNVKQSPTEIHIFLAEKNLPPEDYAHTKLTSKGFFDEIKVRDFPIRGKHVYLMIKRRRWLDESTGNPVFRDWEMVAKGTRMTKEFAAFLKGIARYQAGKL
ncbi:MAG: transposase family protein [Bacteroidota bacterium]